MGLLRHYVCIPTVSQLYLDETKFLIHSTTKIYTACYLYLKNYNSIN